MTFLTQRDVERLSTELAVANTGNYIFKRFSEDPIVRSLALRPTQTLLEVVRTADAADHAPNLTSEVEGYAAAIAISLSGNLAMLEEYAIARGQGLKWLPQIISAASAAQPDPVSVTTIGRNEYSYKIA